MASISKRTTGRGEPRYDVRWRANGRLVEKAFRKRADAEVFKRKVESAEVAGVDRPEGRQRALRRVRRAVARHQAPP